MSWSIENWKIRTGTLFVLAGLMPVFVPSVLSCAESNDLETYATPWQANLSSFDRDDRHSIGQRLTVSCPPRPAGRMRAQVFGTRTYAGQSSICYAALHAGVISPGGGDATVQINPSAAFHKGSTRFGVTTQDAKKSSVSFVFVYGPSPAADQVRADHLPARATDA